MKKAEWHLDIEEIRKMKTIEPHSKLYVQLSKDNTLIKDHDLLSKDSILTGDKRTYIIQAGKKLGDVFNYLPHGIIDKTETGIGGTTLELDAERNSIVVQPYNYTAWSKTLHSSFSNNYKLFFYGRYTFKNKTVAKTKKISTINIVLTQDSSINAKLLEYIKDCNTNHQPAKITCVADQLQALKDCLNNIGDRFFDSFHLVLDEIDALQEQSTFREVMEDCYKIYKCHPENKRTVISATLMNFHDKVMKVEPYSKIAYDVPQPKNLYLITTTHVEEELIRQLTTLSSNTKAKIVVACNHLGYCMNVITALSKEPSTMSKVFKILCSEANKHKVKGYFDYMASNGILPGDINFITAAYFNGFDINEKYHSIIVAESAKPVLRLSPSVIYQISGRGRQGLLTNRLILKMVTDKKYTAYTLKDLVGLADDRKAIIGLIDRLKKSTNKHSVKAAEAIKNLYITGTQEYPSVCSEDEGNIVVSYLKIDSRLEQQKTHEQYQKFPLLKQALDKRFLVNPMARLHQKDDAKKTEKPDYVLLGTALLTKLEKIKRTEDFAASIKAIKKHLPHPIYPFQKMIIDVYLQACIDVSINLDKLVLHLKTLLGDRYPFQNLKLVKFYLDFFNVLAKKATILEEFHNYFTMESQCTAEKLKEKCIKFAELIQDLTESSSLQVRDIANETHKRPANIRALLTINEVKTNKTRNLKIVGYDPFGIKTATPIGASV